MGRGSDSSEFDQIDRFGLDGVVSDGVAERERLAELLRSIERLPADIHGGLLRSLLDTPRERHLLQSGEAPEIVEQLSRKLINEELLGQIVRPIAATPPAMLRYAASVVGLVSDFVPQLVTLDQQVHLRRTAAEAATLCGLEIPRKKMTDYKLRGSFRSNRRCRSCAAQQHQLEEGSALDLPGLGPQSSYLDEVQEISVQALVPAARTSFQTAASYEEFESELRAAIRSLYPAKAVETLPLLSPAVRFSNLFHPSMDRAGEPGKQLLYDTTLQMLGLQLLEKRPQVVEKRWPVSTGLTKALSGEATLAMSGADHYGTHTQRQLQFAAATVSLYCPQVIRSYLDGREGQFDEADRLIAATAARLGIAVPAGSVG